MSREFENAMCGFAARSILEATKPLARHEIFPEEGIFGQTLSKSWQNRILDWLVKDGQAHEIRKNGVALYEARNRLELAIIAKSWPPLNAGEEDEEDTPMQTHGYNKKEWEKWARVTVALRALKRLLSAHNSDGDSTKVQPRTTLFIAKKGDKFQQRQVIDTGWQKTFLKSLVDRDILYETDENGISLYGIENAAKVQGLIDMNSELCVHTVLWPNEPCQIDHTKGTTEEDDDADQAESEDAPAETEAEASTEPEVKEETEKEKEISEVIDDTIAKVKETAHQDGGDFDTVKAIEQMCDVMAKVSDNIVTANKVQDAGVQLMRRVMGEIEHLHSKLDKIHDENVHLRKEHEAMDKVLDDMSKQIETVTKAVNPEESSMNAIRKRLTEMEKLAKEHSDALNASNKLMKGSLAEAAAAMVQTAAKAFIQADHSVVLAKMESVESQLIEEQSRTQTALREVFEALDKVRAEYKSHTKTPAILDRMNAIAEELQRLQGLLPDLPAAIRAPTPDLSDV